MRTLDEFRRERPLPQRERPENSVAAQTIVREAVRMEAVTGDPDWDHYNAYLEAAVKMAERVRDEGVRKLRDPFLVNDEAIRALKASITRLDARIDTLKEVLALPKLIKERAALVKPQIAEMTQDTNPGRANLPR